MTPCSCRYQLAQVLRSWKRLEHSFARSLRKNELCRVQDGDALPIVCDIFGVAADEGLVIMDFGTTETFGSLEALQSLVSSIPRTYPDAHVKIYVEAERAMSFTLADGTTTSACSLVWLQTLTVQATIGFFHKTQCHTSAPIVTARRSSLKKRVQRDI